MELQIFKITFKDVQLTRREIPKLRGYFAEKFENYPEMHNHLPGERYSYSFPRIQYRVIEGAPAIIAFNEGVEIIKKTFFDIDRLNIAGKNLHTIEKEVTIVDTKIEQTSTFIDYQFVSPWMALNEENYNIFKSNTLIEQQKQLKAILRSNLLTISKGMKYTIPDYPNINVEGYFRPTMVNFKNNKMLCFYGNFAVNFYIPKFLGLGKQSARGFGLVQHNSSNSITRIEKQFLKLL